MIDVKTKQFGILQDGRKVTAFEMTNGNGMSVRILNYGCTIQSIVVPDRNNVPMDVVLGYDNISSYEEGSCFYGAVVGRYANRLGDARFTLDGKEYLLEKTSENKMHHLHGVYAKRLFDGHIDGNALVFNYYSPDGEEGFPGNLDVEIRYTLGEDNALTISYKATTDAPTILNLTKKIFQVLYFAPAKYINKQPYIS